MQKVQIGGGLISPTVAAHVQKTFMPTKLAQSSVNMPVMQVGGGIISPNVNKHVAASAKITMGGGVIHPHVSTHVQAQ